MDLNGLIGQDLTKQGFSVKEMTEVYKIDVDGKKEKSLGFFKSEDVATGLAKIQADADYHITSTSFILTDGKAGFVIREEIEIFNEDEAILSIKKAAMAKLTKVEIQALGLPE